MKIAIFSDPHLGYARFEEDSFIQAERAILSANEKADIIICAGDIFDIKTPKLETLKRAIDIFKKTTLPLYAIFGNHERRSKELTNPVELLESATSLKLLHAKEAVFEKNNERIQIFGLGSVPEEYAELALKKSLEKFQPQKHSFKILVLHQSIKELMIGAEEELSLEYLETLPFDLIINGHIHKTIKKLDDRFLIPGSTVITQLKKDEVDPKGYFLYDTSIKKAEFIEIPSRKFFYEELFFDNASETLIQSELTARITKLKTTHPDSILAIKLNGTLKSGLNSSDIRISNNLPDVFIDNRLNSENLSERLEQIRNIHSENISIRDMALKELSKKLEGKITIFDIFEMFDKLSESAEVAYNYIDQINANK